MRTPKRLALILSMLMIGAASGSLAVQPSAFAGTMSSAGPLAVIAVTPDLNCAVHHVGENRGAFYDDTACGTLVAVKGKVGELNPIEKLFGPATIPAGLSASPRTPFTPTPDKPQTVTGTGIAGDPFTIETVVDLGTTAQGTATGLQLTETDTYIVGQETYQTDVRLTNSGTVAVNAIVYRAGDCYLQGSAEYGRVGPSGAIACATNPDPNAGGRIVQWVPITSGSNYLAGGYNAVWTAIGARQPFPDTCGSCTNPLDSGAGLSWSVTVPANGTTAVSSRITVTDGVAPAGPTDLSVTMADSPDPVTPGGNLSYTATVTNAGPSAASGVNLGIATVASTSFVSFTSPSGWWCTTPQPGGQSPVSCGRSSLAVATPQVFTLVVKVDPATPGGLLTTRADVSSSTADPNQANNSDTETTSVSAAPPVPPAGDSLMAVSQTAVLPQMGGGTFTAKANDVVRYSAAANAYSRVFRGDGVGLSGATIDGLAVIPNTEDLILSFTASRIVNGVGTVHGEDLVAFHPTTPGNMTQGTFRLFFDGSDIGLTTTGENIDAVDVGPNGTIYLSTQGAFDVLSGAARRTGNDKDIVACSTPTLVGTTSACSGGVSTYRSGSTLGLTSSSENVDAFDLTAGGSDILSTTGSYTATGDTGQGTNAFACNAGTCSRFFTGASHSLARLADIETGTLLP